MLRERVDEIDFELCLVQKYYNINPLELTLDNFYIYLAQIDPINKYMEFGDKEYDVLAHLTVEQEAAIVSQGMCTFEEIDKAKEKLKEKFPKHPKQVEAELAKVTGFGKSSKKLNISK